MTYSDVNLMYLICRASRQIRHKDDHVLKSHGYKKRNKRMSNNYLGDINPSKDRVSREPMGRERIIAMLDTEDAVCQSKLAEQLGIRPQSLSEMLMKLEKDGFIIKMRSEQDKRETLVSLSDNGKAYARGIKNTQSKQTDDALTPLNEREKQKLFELLTKLLDGNEEY